MLKLLGDVGGLYTGVFFIFCIIVERLQKFNADAFATTHLFVQSSEAFRQKRNTIAPTAEAAFKKTDKEGSDIFLKLRKKTFLSWIKNGLSSRVPFKKQSYWLMLLTFFCPTKE